MFSSSHNSNFLKSKITPNPQQSQSIYEDNEFKILNKQNNSYNLNKSNNSYLSILKEKSGFMISKSGFTGSRSAAIIMGESKAKNGLVPIEENHKDHSKSGNITSSILKSYKNNPKILTESDLTDNQECDFFLEQQIELNPNHYASKQSKQKQQKNQNKYQYLKQKQIKTPIKTQEDYQYEQESFEAPPFLFVPYQKLQIKNFIYQPIINKKCLALINLLELIPHNIATLKTVKKLTVVNCFLTTLKGIQSFESLEDVNFRNNQLRQVDELYRIQNKDKIFSINVTGNDIEHFHLGRFQNLSQIFPNLSELNDKNYSMLKCRGKGDMKKILKKSAKLQHQLKSTLKKQIRRTDRAFIRMNSNTEFTQTSRFNPHQQKQKSNIIDQKDDCSCQNGNNYLKYRNQFLSRGENSSKISPKHSNYCSGASFQKKKQVDNENQVYEILASNQNSYSLGDSTNNKVCPKNEVMPLKQVSLANIQNVPITKSVKCRQKSPKKIHSSLPNKQNVKLTTRDQIPLQTVPLGKNLLEIKTEDLDNQPQLNVHLHQPTATFAMQKEKEQKCNVENKQFMFRNKKTNELKTKVNRYTKDEEEIFQELQNDDQDAEMNMSRISRLSQIPTKRLSNNLRYGISNIGLKPENRLYDINQNNSDQSFVTGNEFYINCQNGSYMAYSQLTQFRPNQSMDDDCLLKQNRNGLEQQKLAIASAVYMRNLVTKSLFALFLQANKRKNLPKKRIFI